MKRFLLALATIVCVGLGLAVAQNIQRSIQLSQSPIGPFGVDAANSVYFPGKVMTAGSSPTLSGFGTGGSITGSDFAGILQAGTGSSTTAAFAFRTAFTSSPYCTANASSSTAVGVVATPGGVSFTLSSGAVFGQQIMYSCIGRSTG